MRLSNFALEFYIILLSFNSFIGIDALEINKCIFYLDWSTLPQDLTQDVENLQKLLTTTESNIQYLPKEGYDEMIKALEVSLCFTFLLLSNEEKSNKSSILLLWRQTYTLNLFKLYILKTLF